MEVMPGYKQTEIGVIPEDWAVIPMAELFTFQNGVNADKAAYGKGIPFINVLEIITHSTLTEERIPGRISLPPQTNSAFRVQTGDVLFNRTSETQEEVGLASVYIDNREVVFGGFVIRARPRNGSLDPMFSSYALRSPLIRQQIISRGQGAVRANIGQQDLSKVQLFVPSLPEQEAIAAVLSNADAIIESYEQLIAKKHLLKKGVMRELLTGKRRLRGFASATTSYKQTEVGVIPEDWDCVRIGELIDLLTGFPFPSRSYSKSGVRLLRGSNVKRGVTDWSEEGTEYWPAISSEIKKYVLKSGDIVVAMDGSLVGRSFAMLSESDVPALLLQRVARIRSSVVDQKFLKAWICSQRFTEHCDTVKTVTAIPHISPSDIRSFTIALPPVKAEQEAIGAILFDMDAEVALLEAQLAKYRQLKQGLMQKLLTGRIRLI